MNHHATPIPGPSEATTTLAAINAANERQACLSAANHCLKLIYQRRRQMARFARFGHHVWAWQEYREIIKAKDRRRDLLAKAERMATETHERIDA